jgi:hypothetical protein
MNNNKYYSADLWLMGQFAMCREKKTYITQKEQHFE